MTTYYVHRNGETVGPFQQSEIAERFRSGEISEDDLCASEGEESWQPLSAKLKPEAMKKLRTERALRDGTAARRLNWSESFGKGLLVQVFGFLLFLVPLWIVTVPLGILVILVGALMARGKKCSSCGTKLPDRKAPRCPGCRAQFLAK